ncbi:MAG TPA: alpha/beta hydrolase [Chitinophagales bacterium]|nr:alpha/beta hydrolase [Chitinophagales bacterium]MCB0510937.1 alpha/beta hydrolase [Bacteroidota bacterium]MCB9075288.1 alpha/beta hydrolase [Chitinophagales bacterium]HMU97264.1 alpha/beta hydrolase [Chitinophagales bacterium]HMV02845.1 alpha/beta hydrolase [Chitinophagales bacterium]
MIRKLTYIAFIFLLFSCKKDKNSNQFNNYYFLKIDDVALPINITGNKIAEHAVIYINDGLNSNVNTEKNNVYWQYIENKYKVVYYDQRGSGTAQGNTKPSEMSIEQFAADLDKVIDFTFKIAKVRSVILHGSGIGGAVACFYASDSTRQEKINGLILEAPAYDLKNGLALSKQKVIDLADERIATNNNPGGYWTNLKNYYTEHPVFNSEVFEKHINVLMQNNGLFFNLNNVKQRKTDAPSTPLDVIYKNQLNAYAQIKYNNSYFSEMDMTPLLSKLDLPILLVWGEQDMFLPKDNLALKFKLATGSNVTYNPTKYIQTGHIPHAEDFFNFQVDALSFINSYK